MKKIAITLSMIALSAISAHAQIVGDTEQPLP